MNRQNIAQECIANEQDSKYKAGQEGENKSIVTKYNWIAQQDKQIMPIGEVVHRPHGKQDWMAPIV